MKFVIRIEGMPADLAARLEMERVIITYCLTLRKNPPAQERSVTEDAINP